MKLFERATSLDFIGQRTNEKRKINSNLQNANNAVFYYTQCDSLSIFSIRIYNLHENLQTPTIFYTREI